MPRLLRPVILILLYLVGVSAAVWPLSAQSSPPIQDDGTTADSTPSATLRPGDVIRLAVWREPDWSGDFVVQPSGVAVLPRIGPVNVTGSSPEALTRMITDSLATYLRNPSIQVNLLRRIRILGAVKNPGLYPVDPSVTVADALALAGGATSDGKVDRVVLRRDGGEFDLKLTQNTRLAGTPMQTGDQLYVPQRGWIGRNAGLVAAGLSAATTVVVALLIR